MIITRSEEVIEVKQIPVGKVCNKCSNVFEPYDEDTQSYDPMIDRVRNRFELCKTCLLNFIRTFDIVPDNFSGGSEYIPGYTPSYILDHELHQSLFEDWKSSGKWNCDENPWRDYFSDIENKDEETNETDCIVYEFCQKPEVSE